MRIFRIILTILSPFLSIVQPTIERNSHHYQLYYQTYLSVTILKGIRVVSPVGRFAGSFCPGSFRPCFRGGSIRPYKVILLTVTALTFLNKKLLTDTTSRGLFTIKAEMCFYIKANLENGNPDMLNKLSSL